MPRLKTYRLSEILGAGAHNIRTQTLFENSITTRTAYGILEDVKILVDRFQMYVFNTAPASKQYKVVYK